MNPIARIAAAIVAALAVFAAFFFGLAILVVLVGAFSLITLAFFVRSWWHRRAGRGEAADKSGERSGIEVIDAEYTVVSRRQEREL